MNPLTTLPVIPESALPADVRNGSAEDRKHYQAALGFESVLVGQLLEAATASTPLASGPQAGLVQDAFAGALMANGGLGLGAQLFETMRAARGETS